MNTKNMITLSLVAVLYIILSMAVSTFSFGALQFRIGEMLVVLPFFNKKYTLSLTLGCLIVNLFSPLGVIDVFFGTLSTLLMCLTISHIKNIWLIPLVAALYTGIMIGLELSVVYKLPLIETIVIVGMGELLTVFVGVIIFNLIKKQNKYVYNLLVDL